MIVFGLSCPSRFHQSVDLTPVCSLRRLFRGEMPPRLVNPEALPAWRRRFN